MSAPNAAARGNDVPRAASGDRLYAEDVAARRGETPEALLSRLREVEAAHAADPTRCAAPDCEELLPESVLANGGRYCNGTCRKDTSRARRAARDRAARDQERGEADPGLLLILAGSFAALMAAAGALAIVTGLLG